MIKYSQITINFTLTFIFSLSLKCSIIWPSFFNTFLLNYRLVFILFQLFFYIYTLSHSFNSFFCLSNLFFFFFCIILLLPNWVYRIVSMNVMNFTYCWILFRGIWINFCSCWLVIMINIWIFNVVVALLNEFVEILYMIMI